MTSIRTLTAIAALLTAMAGPTYATDSNSHETHHPASTAKQQMTQTEQPAIGMRMGSGIGPGKGGRMAPAGFTEQMQAMRAMHEKMVAAKTPEERSELMTEHMKLMQNGMAMMGRMSGGAMAGGNRPGAAPVQPGDAAARQGMMAQRMDMMQSMMQMMMDRMMPAPTKN